MTDMRSVFMVDRSCGDVDFASGSIAR
jgi:hypothetical protein